MPARPGVQCEETGPVRSKPLAQSDTLHIRSGCTVIYDLTQLEKHFDAEYLTHGLIKKDRAHDPTLLPLWHHPGGRRLR